MKRLINFFLLVALTLVASCGEGLEYPQNKDIGEIKGCETPIIDEPIYKDLPKLRTAQKRVKVLAVIGRRMVQDYGSYELALNGLQHRFEQVNAQMNVDFASAVQYDVDYIIATQTTDFWAYMPTNTALHNLKKHFPSYPADIILYVDSGFNSGVASRVGGATKEGENYAVVMIDRVQGNYPNFNKGNSTLAHELGHQIGMPHTHDCVHSYVYNGVMTYNLPIDAIGLRLGYGSASCTNLYRHWDYPSEATTMSYGILNSNLNNVAKFHPIHINMAMNYLNSVQLGCFNTVQDLRFENGKFVWKDDYNTSTLISVAPYVKGATSFPASTNVVYKSGTQSETKVNTFTHASTYTSSGSQGWKFTPMVQGTYKVKLVGNFPSGTKILYSHGLGNVSKSGALNMSSDSTVTMPSGSNYINVRPDKNGINARVYLTQSVTTTIESNETIKEYIPSNLLQGRMYSVRFTANCGGVVKDFMVMTSPSNILSTIYDSGGASGVHDANEDIWYYKITPPNGQRVKLTFNGWWIPSGTVNNYLEVYVNNTLYATYNGTNRPPTSIVLNGSVSLHWVSGTTNRSAGFEITPSYE